eukprot:CAMPEP_0175050940 /NCGR_PEP_ID=MMETSP0052_2-20121109/7523_1 /TAXON_ID=51329 ORGANISM="Polytomella parva, Strain SAG 63-3" /NCGR_SAMPLE_ID=MMETSP0052_2 /ASSEMBLY_ACC=CAM_ASM_000194 /LENGTH=338 /DNA_ID=CAMNT_0016315169 /DNA_START=155 /DNA_END=1171 /DNA_ORIENTATION=-
MNIQQNNRQRPSTDKNAITIEEINDDTPSYHQRSHNEPIVEEPDEEVPQGSRRHRRRTSYSRNEPTSSNQPSVNNHFTQGQTSYVSNNKSNNYQQQYDPYGHQPSLDPIQQHHQHHQQMLQQQSLFNMADPFGGLLGGAFGGGFGNMTALMNNAMTNMLCSASNMTNSSMNNFCGGNGGSYMFSSSSYSSTGPNGQCYSKSTSTKVGPGGVRETQSCVRDGYTGHQEMCIQRGLGDRERTVTRRRDVRGREEQVENLKNLQADEGEAFEEEWLEHADRNLLKIGQSGIGISSRRGRGQGNAPLAITAGQDRGAGMTSSSAAGKGNVSKHSVGSGGHQF